MQKTVDTVSLDKNAKDSVKHYMATQLITFKPDSDISDVVNTLLDKHITGAAVLNDHKEVVGIIDDKTCLKLLVGSEYYNSPVTNQPVSNYMDDVMMTVSEHTSISEAANIFLETKYKRLLVVDDAGKLVGQISRRDVLRAVRDINTISWNR
ncbi:MAG: CBS domain-containing protein [Saprospiraceae bacterium]